MFVSSKQSVVGKHIHKGNEIAVNVKVSCMDLVSGGDHFQQQARCRSILAVLIAKGLQLHTEHMCFTMPIPAGIKTHPRRLPKSYPQYGKQGPAYQVYALCPSKKPKVS